MTDDQFDRRFSVIYSLPLETVRFIDDECERLGLTRGDYLAQLIAEDDPADE